MKIRVISDLHIDVNEEYPFTLKDKDIFTIICGDLSGYFMQRQYFRIHYDLSTNGNPEIQPQYFYDI